MAALARAEDFARHRDRLVAIAYRLLGSVDEAEDVVQDALAKADRAPDDLVEPLAWLTRVVTNAALDRLGSARARREAYVGPWLPEPVVGSPWSGGGGANDPADLAVLGDEMSLALLTVLETLSPAERAVYVLHEAFAVPLAEVAGIVGRSEAACRQLAVRARRHVAARAPRFDADRAERARVVEAFRDACATGDIAALAALLDGEVVLRADGGGVVSAARRPIRGRDRVVRTVLAALRTAGMTLDRRAVNGDPGLVAVHREGTAVLAFVVRDGRIAGIDIVANPDKLRRVGPPPPT